MSTGLMSVIQFVCNPVDINMIKSKKYRPECSLMLKDASPPTEHNYMDIL